MQLRAQRGTDYLLDYGDGTGCVLDDVTGEHHERMPLVAILARGYWEPVSSEPERQYDDWEEREHPRDRKGRFARKPGGPSVRGLMPTVQVIHPKGSGRATNVELSMMGAADEQMASAITTWESTYDVHTTGTLLERLKLWLRAFMQSADTRTRELARKMHETREKLAQHAEAEAISDYFHLTEELVHHLATHPEEIQHAAQSVEVLARSIGAFEERELWEERQHPRDRRGRFRRKVGGAGALTDALKKLKALKLEWAKIDNQMLAYEGQPRHPEFRKLAKRQKQITKEIHHLDIDQGGPKFIGLPGGPKDVVIVGAGPAGVSAGIYGASEGLDTLVVADRVGGQAGLSSRIENVMGFPAGIRGADYARHGMEQMQRLGADTRIGVHVTKLDHDPDTGLKHLQLSDGSEISARTVIIAGGVQFRHLSFYGSTSPDVIYGDSAGLKELCDEADATIVGGGNSAGQAALDVATEAKHVHLIVRSEIEKGMSSYLIDQLRSNPKVTIHEHAEIDQANMTPDNRITGVKLKDGTELPSKGVGVYVGSAPSTSWTDVAKDKRGYVEVGKGDSPLETSIPGVYAAGDVRTGSIKRVVTAVGDGAAAIAASHERLLKLERYQEDLLAKAKKGESEPEIPRARPYVPQGDVAEHILRPRMNAPMQPWDPWRSKPAWQAAEDGDDEADQWYELMEELDEDEPYTGADLSPAQMIQGLAFAWNELEHPRDDDGKWREKGVPGIPHLSPADVAGKFLTMSEAQAKLGEGERGRIEAQTLTFQPPFAPAPLHLQAGTVLKHKGVVVFLEDGLTQEERYGDTPGNDIIGPTDHEAAANQAIDRIDDEFPSRLSERLNELYVTTQADSMETEMKAQNPDIDPLMVAITNPREQRMIFWHNGIGLGNQATHTTRHEFGHLIDMDDGDSGAGRYSGMNGEWLTAPEIDAPNAVEQANGMIEQYGNVILTPYGGQGSAVNPGQFGVSDYGSGSPMEDFAESVSWYTAGEHGVHPMYGMSMEDSTELEVDQLGGMTIAETRHRIDRLVAEGRAHPLTFRDLFPTRAGILDQILSPEGGYEATPEPRPMIPQGMLPGEMPTAEMLPDEPPEY